MHPYTKPALTALACLGLVLSGVAVGLPADDSAPGPGDSPSAGATTQSFAAASTAPATVSNDHLVLSVTGTADGDATGRFDLTTAAADEPADLLEPGTRGSSSRSTGRRTPTATGAGPN
jgi:hypothetical protein